MLFQNIFLENKGLYKIGNKWTGKVMINFIVNCKLINRCNIKYYKSKRNTSEIFYLILFL